MHDVNLGMLQSSTESLQRWVYFVLDYITTSNIIIYRRKHIVPHLSTYMMWFSMYEGFITIYRVSLICHIIKQVMKIPILP